MDLDMRVDALFSEDENILRRSIRRFVESEYVPLMEECYEAGRFPTEMIPKIAELGVLGMKIEDYGCPGWTNVMYGIACVPHPLVR